MEVPQKIKNRATLPFSDPTSRHRTQKRESRFLHTHVHKNTIVTAKRWKQPRSPQTDEWIDKETGLSIQWNVMQPEKKEILTHPKSWVGLEELTLSKISQA